MSQLYFPSLSPENMTSDGPTTVAELQGALCGLLCLNTQANRNNWYNTLFEDYRPGPDEQQNLIGLFDETIQALNSLDAADQDESNFAELVEYLRMGLFLLYGELQPPENNDNSTEH